jgi:hypothetical protein
VVGRICGFVKILSSNLPGMNEEVHANTSQDSLCLCQDSKQPPLEYNSEALTFYSKWRKHEKFELNLG